MYFSNALLGINVVIEMESTMEGAAAVTVSQPVNVEALATQIETVIASGGMLTLFRSHEYPIIKYLI